jgi:hypothetical protein
MQTLFTEKGWDLYFDNDIIPWQEHPRPLLRRDSFLNLCGWWDFSVANDGAPVRLSSDKIRVPFPPESVLSGVSQHFAEGASLIYERKVTLPPGFRKDIVLLHIDAADQHADVYINDEPVGSHDGGYSHFTLDISTCEDEFTLKIITYDDLMDSTEPYGKQRLKRGGMWYTPFSGLWQPVWIESVPKKYVKTLRIETDMEQAFIDTQDPSLNGTVTVVTPDGTEDYPLSSGKAVIFPDDPRLWSPDDPYLYQFTLHTDSGDTVCSYFAMRDISIRVISGIRRLLLNNKPYFFNGLLDQGYYCDGLCTPADPSLFDQDILTAKSLGFNTLRKHIKVESDLFYAACDRLGIIVFQDIVNNGKYSFLSDTLLPNIGFKEKKDFGPAPTPDETAVFLKRMDETVEQLISFPCIMYWTIFNEGWGQSDSREATSRLRALDPSRIIDSASGWFDQRAGDVKSVHIYNHTYHFEPDIRPVILSECGGYTYRVKDHVFNKKAYGYGRTANSSQLLERIKRLYLNEVQPVIAKGLCGAIYTQLSDVEDETNGVVTYDRKVVKLPSDEMCELFSGLVISPR